jgi:hypothetical protein
MTDIVHNKYVKVHPSEAKLSSFLDSDYILIVFTVSVYCIPQILFRVLLDSSTNIVRDVLFDCRRPRVDIVFHELLAETNHNRR